MNCECEGARCALTTDDPRHGRNTGYAKHHCRCDDCRDAHADYMLEYQSGRTAERAAIDARHHARHREPRLARMAAYDAARRAA